LTDGEYCFWHDPANEKEVAEARRMGGLNRKREQTLATVYELEGLGTLEDIQRVYELALMQNLALENSVARNRAIADTATAAARLYRDNEMARQMEQIKSVIEGRLPASQPRKKRWGLF
jgi:DNA-binding helix-hairpin-helix protein with protein kinase domain